MLSVHHDPSWCGADDFAVTYKRANDPDPQDGDAPTLTGSVIGFYFDPAGASVSFTLQPQNVSAVAGATANFTAGATGTSPYGGGVTYQWQSAPKGSSTWSDIPGATSASYRTPAVTAGDDGKQFRVVASVPPVSATSSVAMLTVSSDTTPPSATAGAMLSSTAGTVDVGVAFDEPINPATLQLDNFSVSPGTITGMTVYTNRFTANSQEPESKISRQSVLLKVTGLSSSGTLTIRNIADANGNTLASTTFPLTVDTVMNWGVVGANEGGSYNMVVPISQGGFDVFSDGVSEWATYDESTFVYQQVTGDFDKKVRVEYQDGSSQWARAGLIAREVTNFGVDRNTQTGSAAAEPPFDGQAGRYQKCHVNPVGATLTGPGTAGNQNWECNRRLDTGGPTSSPGITGSIPLYPNAWCRIKREGQKFTMFRSDDGVNWVELASTTWGVTNTPMAATLYVGPEYSPEIGNVTQEEDKGTFLARFRDYGDFVAAIDSQLKIGRDGTGKIAISWTSGTLVSSPTVDGTHCRSRRDKPIPSRLRVARRSIESKSRSRALAPIRSRADREPPVRFFFRTNQ
jgi:hypothetical protein